MGKRWRCPGRSRSSMRTITMAAREYWAVRAPMLAWRRQPDGCVTSLRRTGLGSRHRVFREQQGICNYSAPLRFRRSCSARPRRLGHRQNRPRPTARPSAQGQNLAAPSRGTNAIPGPFLSIRTGPSRNRPAACTKCGQPFATNQTGRVIAAHETLDLPPIRPIVDTKALAGIGSFKAIRSVVAA